VNYYSLNSIKVVGDGDYTDQLKDKAKVVFLYSDSNSLSLYQGLINQYDMGTLEQKVYSNNIKYEDMLLVNEGLLEAYYNSVNVKK
jgi:hypothetical protein